MSRGWWARHLRRGPWGHTSASLRTPHKTTSAPSHEPGPKAGPPLGGSPSGRMPPRSISRRVAFPSITLARRSKLRRASHIPDTAESPRQPRGVPEPLETRRPLGARTVQSRRNHTRWLVPCLPEFLVRLLQVGIRAGGPDCPLFVAEPLVPSGWAPSERRVVPGQEVFLLSPGLSAAFLCHPQVGSCSPLVVHNAIHIAPLREGRIWRRGRLRGDRDPLALTRGSRSSAGACRSSTSARYPFASMTPARRPRRPAAPRWRTGRSAGRS